MKPAHVCFLSTTFSLATTTHTTAARHLFRFPSYTDAWTSVNTEIIARKHFTKYHEYKELFIIQLDRVTYPLGKLQLINGVEFTLSTSNLSLTFVTPSLNPGDAGYCVNTLIHQPATPTTLVLILAGVGKAPHKAIQSSARTRALRWRAAGCVDDIQILCQA